MRLRTKRVRVRRLASLAVFFLLANLGGQAFAQAGPGDTPPTISFLNPSAETSLIVSGQRAADVTYRLSAWVDDPTVSPLVEFELQQGNDRPITIGTASRATVDTFELLWTVPPWLPEGSYTLRAMLFSGITEVARDEETISLVASTPSSRRDATVDITNPSVGGLLGLFATSASTTGIMQVAVSDDATFVRSFYTTSAPGQKPDWKQCGVESRAQAANGLRCTLQPEDPGDAVKAISAVANESDASGTVSSAYDGASDAKRITTYKQKVESLTVSPSSQVVQAGSNGVFPCSQSISATVFDQVGRPIAGANVDAHGVGPTDQLAFDTGTAAAPTGSVAPNQGHVAYETGYDCAGANDETALAQGEHNVPGAPDLKHVESNAAGTDDEGKFSIRAYSLDEGLTQLQIWVDETEDDADTGELSLAASIDWGGTVPPPPPPPDPEPEPPFERAISLASDKNQVRKGGHVRLGGVIASDAGECVSGQEVRLRVRGPNGRHFRTIASTSSDDQGVFIFRIRAFRTRDYRAVAPRSDTCLKARSSDVTVSVRR